MGIFMRRICIFIILIALITLTSGVYSRNRPAVKSIPAQLVEKIYRIYKQQNYREGLAITTGTMLKRFTKLNDHLRMNQNKIPDQLKRLSERMSGYRFVGEYTHTYNGKEFTLVDCIWIMKSRDTSPQSMGIIQTKLVVRAYMVKKVNNEWKVSSEKFITEHILREEEHKLIERIRRQIELQRQNQRRGIRR